MSSLSNLVDNLAEGIHEVKHQDCDCFLEYESANDNLTKYKCLSSNKNYSNKMDEELKSPFKSTLKFSNNDINKFILLLRKDVYSYEYKDEWEQLTKHHCLKKKIFIVT